MGDAYQFVAQLGGEKRLLLEVGTQMMNNGLGEMKGSKSGDEKEEESDVIDVEK